MIGTSKTIAIPSLFLMSLLLKCAVQAIKKTKDISFEADAITGHALFKDQHGDGLPRRVQDLLGAPGAPEKT